MSTYPLNMFHPQARQGVAIKVDPEDPRSDYHGVPDILPPVTVNNADQEERHRSMGYLAEGETVGASTKLAEYPLCLTHPDYEEAIPAIPPSNNFEGRPGVPEKFPARIVHNAAEKAAAEKKGYRVVGQQDAAAFEKASAAPFDPRFHHSEYPKMVDGKLVQHPDAPIPGAPVEYPMWVNGKIVHNAAEEAAARGERVEAAPEETAPSESDIRLELYERARSKGIPVDKRWGVARLQEVLEAAE